MTPADAPARPPPRRRLLRALVWLTLFLLVTAACVWFAQQRLLSYACGHLSRLSGQPLECVNARGTLPGVLAIDVLRLREKNFLIELHGVRLDLQLDRLFARRVVAESLEIERFEYRQLQSTGKPLRLPARLALPVDAELRDVRVALMRFTLPEQQISLGRVRGRLALERDGWRVSEAQAEYLGQRWSGHATLKPSQPYEIGGAVRVEGGWRGHNWQGYILGRGALAHEVELDGSGFLDKTPVKAQALVAPTARPLVREVRAQLKGWPAHEWIPRLPELVVDAQAEARPDGQGGWQGGLSATNRRPGALNQGRLPALLGRTDWQWQPRPRMLELSKTELLMPDRSTLRGSLRWDGELDVDAVAENISLRHVWTSLHPTRFSGPIRVATADYRDYALSADLRQGKDRLQGRAVINRAGADASSLTLSRGGSVIDGRGRIEFQGRRAFAGRLELRRVDPAAFGSFPAGDINGEVELAGTLQPALDLTAKARIERSRLWEGPLLLIGSGRYRDPGQLELSDTRVGLQGLQARLDGALGLPGRGMTVQADLDGRLRWLPELAGQARIDGRLSGRLRWPAFDGRVSGRNLSYRDWRVERLEASGAAPERVTPLQQGVLPRMSLRLEAEGVGRGELRAGQVLAHATLAPEPEATHLTLQASRLEWGGQTLREASLQIDGTPGRHTVGLSFEHARQSLTLRGEGGLDRVARRWSGRVKQLQGQGAVPVQLKAPFALDLGAGDVAVGTVDLVSRGASLQLQRLQWRPEHWTAAGRFSRLPLRDLWSLLDRQPPKTDLMLGGEWDFDHRQTLNGRARVFREGGDIRPVEELQDLGLNHGTLDLLAVDNRLEATLDVRSAAIGKLQARVGTRLSERGGRLGLAGDAPLNGRVQLDTSSLAWLGQWFTTPGYTFSGALAGDVALGGRLGDPSFTGALTGRQLGFKSATHGVDLRQGSLDATVDRDRLLVNQLRFLGGAGTVEGKGMLSLRQEDPDISVELVARKLTLSNRPDQTLIVSGTGRATLRKQRLALSADAKVDRGFLLLKSSPDTDLDDDIVLPAGRRAAAAPERKVGIYLNARLDLGEDFQVRHRSFNAYAKGVLRMDSSPERPSVLTGNVELDRGAITAYGQKLALETSTLNFNGPPDNPSLNLKAYRERLYNSNGEEIKVGVNLTGYARKPALKLISEPEMSDRQKLTWLVFGQDIYKSSTPTAGGTSTGAAGSTAGGKSADERRASDTAVLTTAAKALFSELGDNAGPDLINRAFGIDEISVQQDANDVSRGIVKIGKQLVPNLYISYGKGYNDASDELQLNYLFNKKWSIEVKGGDQSAVDLFYTISFD